MSHPATAHDYRPRTSCKVPATRVARLRRPQTSCTVDISNPGSTLDAERRRAMSYSILTLLTRNLHDVFGENDPARRREAIDEIFTKAACSMNPGGAYCGRDEV